MPTPMHHIDRFARVSIVVLGASTALLQTLAVREGLAIASGNEAVIALLLAVWMVSTAIGASVGRFDPTWLQLRTHHALVLYAVLIPVTLLAVRASNLLLDPGSTPSLLTTALASAVLLWPACACSGWIYARLAKGPFDLDPVVEARWSARAYWLDTLGAGVAGALLALVALDHVLPFRLAAGASALVVASASLGADRRRRARYLVVAGVLALGVGAPPIDALSYRWLVPGQTIDHVESTSRGVLLATVQNEQSQVFLDRDPMLVPSDGVAGEQVGHLSAALHPAPRQALFIGIPPGDTLVRLLAHGLVHVDVVAGDAKLAEAVATYAPGARDPRVTIQPHDERAFARSLVGPAYDLITVHAGMPTSVAGARLASTEFFRDLARALRSGGVLVVTAAPHAAYATADQRRMHATFAASLRAVFGNVRVLPADWTLYVASNDRLPDEGAVASLLRQRLRDRAIDAEVVTDTWLEDRLSAERIEQARLWASARVPPSTDTHPHVFRAALDAALAPIGGGVDVLLAIALSLAALLLAWASPRERPLSYSVATTGFTGLALQLVVMLVHQTAVGALYRDVALVTAAYMGASCLGTWLASRREGGLQLILAADAAQLLVAVALAVAVPAMVTSHGAVVARAATITAAGLVGLVTGAQIAWASRSNPVLSGVAGAVYAVDLAGAALAALVTVTFVIPSIGLAGACWAVAGVKATSFTALLWKERRGSPEPSQLRVPLPLVLLMLVVGIVILPSAQRHVVAWTQSTWYSAIVLAVLGAMLLAAFEPIWLRARVVSWERRLRGMTSRLGLSPLRAVQFAVLVPVAALPLGRCFFTVPFLFCHVCPRPCVFGLMRPYVVAASLLGNLGDRRFCERVCPLGHAQSAAWRGRRTHRPMTRGALWLLRFAALAAVVVLYLQARDGHSDDPSGVFVWFYAQGYLTPVWALASAGLFLAGAFTLRRPFCEGACPIGAVSDLVGRLEQRWVRAAAKRGDPDA